MKIRSLRFSNLNSLKGEYKIDFATGVLADAGIFAITGKTGAGKSTILDAITLALFGKAARYDKEQNPEHMMSRGTATCFAEVYFETSSGIYRAYWERRRSRNKVDGKMQTAKRELSDVHHEILAEKLNDVDKLVTSLSGMDYARFLRSVILAQGNFKEFLDAKKNERGELLERITGTDIYSKISVRAFDVAKEKREAINNARARIEGITLIDEETLNAFVEEHKKLQTTIEGPEKKLTILEKSMQLYDQLREAQTRLYSTRADVQKNKTELVDFAPSLDFLQRFTKATDLQLEYRSLTDLQLQRRKTQTAHLSAQQAYATHLQTAVSNLHEILSSLQGETERIEKEKTDCAQQNEDLIQAQTEIYAAFSGGEYTLCSLSDAQALKAQLAQEKETLLTSHANVKRIFEVKKQFAVKKAQQLKREEKITCSIEEEKQLLLTNETVEKDLVHELEILKDKERIERQQQLIASLSERRADLVNGEPCNLCGATEHPYAHSAPEADDEDAHKLILQKEKVQALQKHQHQVQKKTAGLISALQTTKKEHEQTQAELDEIRTNFKTLASLTSFEGTLTEDTASLQKHLDDIALQGKHISGLLQKVDALEKTSRDEQKIHHTTTQLELQEKVLHEEKQTYDAALSLYDSTYVRLASPQKMTSKQRRERCSHIQTAQSSLRAQQSTYHTDLEHLAHEDEIKSNTLFEHATKAGFASLSDLAEQLACSKKAAQLQTKQSCLETDRIRFESAHAEAQKRIDELEKQSPPAEDELSPITSQIHEIKETLNNVRERRGQLTELITTAEDAHKKHASQIKTILTMEEDAKPWNVLHDIIGSKDGAKFSTCAQGLTLEQLVQLANKYLDQLNERYSIARIAGTDLELEIIDHYQADMRRPTKSLSGGESFLVSLALALGLSELSGQNTKIESLFIDEGFGTLDGETLDIALSALETLRLDNRTIGVISHVESLKTRIATQIQVQKQSDGTACLEIVEYA